MSFAPIKLNGFSATFSEAGSIVRIKIRKIASADLIQFRLQTRPMMAIN